MAGAILMQRTLGKYHIIAELGSGGMSDVFLSVARGPAGFSKLVVVKVLRGSLVKQDPAFVPMFLDEARLAAHLNHPNVVQTNEVGQDGDRYFIAMEYLEGQSLHHLLRRARKEQGRLPLPMFLHIVSRALEGLHAAHTAKSYDGTSLNIVHRDASPHNVFVTYDGHVKVVDFGIAKANGRLADATQMGVLKGKLAFMPPEQAQGGEVDCRTDLFAMGVILFDYLADRRLWKGRTEVEILGSLVRKDYPRSPRQCAQGEGPNGQTLHVPEELDAICQRALAPNPAERYPTARAMQADIDAYLERTGSAPTQRDIGEYVSQLFMRERVAMATAVEQQLRLMSENPNATTIIPMSVPDLRAVASQMTPSGGSRSVARPSGGTENIARPIEVDLARQNKVPVGAWLTGFAMILGLGLVIGVLVLRAQRLQSHAQGGGDSSAATTGATAFVVEGAPNAQATADGPKIGAGVEPAHAPPPVAIAAAPVPFASSRKTTTSTPASVAPPTPASPPAVARGASRPRSVAVPPPQPSPPPPPPVATVQAPAPAPEPTTPPVVVPAPRGTKPDLGY